MFPSSFTQLSLDRRPSRRGVSRNKKIPQFEVSNEAGRPSRRGVSRNILQHDMEAVLVRRPFRRGGSINYTFSPYIFILFGRPSRRGVSRNCLDSVCSCSSVRRPSRRGVSRNTTGKLQISKKDCRPSRRGVSRNLEFFENYCHHSKSPLPQGRE